MRLLFTGAGGWGVINSKKAKMYEIAILGVRFWCIDGWRRACLVESKRGCV